MPPFRGAASWPWVVGKPSDLPAVHARAVRAVGPIAPRLILRQAARAPTESRPTMMAAMMCGTCGAGPEV